MSSTRKFMYSALAAATLVPAGCGETPMPTKDVRAEAAAQYLVSRIKGSEYVEYANDKEVITENGVVSVPLMHDGEYFELDGSKENPQLTHLDGSRTRTLERYAGTGIVSNSGVLKYNPDTQVFSVNAELENGEHQPLAVAQLIPSDG